MGYYQDTCLLSGEPMRPGDQCAFVFIARRPEKPKIKTPDAQYVPVSPVLFGRYRYNTNGWIGKIRNPDNSAAVLANAAFYEKSRSGAYKPLDSREPERLVRTAGRQKLYIQLQDGQRTAFSPVTLCMLKLDPLSEAYGSDANSMNLGRLTALLREHNIAYEPSMLCINKSRRVIPAKT